MRDAPRHGAMGRLAQHFLAVVAISGVAGLAAASSASAADLKPDPYYPKPHAGSPYDDPRYADLYGPDERRPDHRYAPHGKRAYNGRHDYGHDNGDIYYDRYGNRVRRPHRDHRYDERRYDRRYDRYSDRRHYRDHRYDPWVDRHTRRRWNRHWNSGYLFSDHCVPRRLVLRRLRHDGWYNFHDLRFRGPKALVAADNQRGGSYRLVIDRCSGTVIKARRLHYRHTGYTTGHYAPARHGQR